MPERMANASWDQPRAQRNLQILLPSLFRLAPLRGLLEVRLIIVGIFRIDSMYCYDLS